MRSFWRWSWLLAVFFLALALGVLALKPARAQEASAAPADDSDDDEDVTRASVLGVTITLDATGKANVGASYYVVGEPNLPSSEIRAALQSALGCTLQIPARFRPVQGYYAGFCAVPISSQGLLRQGHILTEPLQNFARIHQISSYSVHLQLPDADVLETNPPVEPSSFASPNMPAALMRNRRGQFSYGAWSQHPLPAEMVFRYGYTPATLKRIAAILLGTLLYPLALFVWLGRKALSADVADKAVIWFSYMRSLHWLLNGTLLLWWVALDYCQAEPVLRFLSSGTGSAALAAHPAAYEALSWFPPSILWILCYRISHPVQQKLRGLHWTRRELTLQAFYSVLAGLFPLAMFLTGLRVMATDGFRSAMFWWVGACALRVVAAQALLKLTGMQPQALSSGDLRDRAFAMADRLGVKLQQVYLIPSGKGQMANAFARTSNTISFTDFLLKRMSQREVDYVMAHELTHLKLKHPAKLGYAYISGIFIAVFVLSMSAPFLHFSTVARYALMFTIVSLFPYFWSRRFEYSADAGAVGATSDPRAAISALFKLSELNMMPLHWSTWREKWLTHPSSLRRAQAIAKKSGIAFEDIPVIAREGSAEAQSYGIPSTAAPGAKLQSTQRNKSRALQMSLILIGLLAFVPSLLALAATHFSPPLKWILFAAAIPVTLVALLLLLNYGSGLTRGSLVPALDRKLESQGVQPQAWSGVFVGFSPAAAPRIYDGNANWDIGYLFFRSDRLCYCGEETKFALRQNQITAIRLADGLPSLLGNKRIYIAWKDDERGSCGVFNIREDNGGSLLRSNKFTVELARRLQAWQKTVPATRPLPPQLAELSSPELRSITSHSPVGIRKPKKVFNELFLTGLFASAGAVICGLPFHLLPWLFSASYGARYLRAGLGKPFSTAGAGWYAVGVAVVVRLIALVPSLRYLDVPRVSVEPPVRLAATSAPIGNALPGTAAPEKPNALWFAEAKKR